MNRYKISDSFFVNTDEKWVRIKRDEIKWLRAFENGTVIFLTESVEVPTFIVPDIKAPTTELPSDPFSKLRFPAITVAPSALSVSAL